MLGYEDHGILTCWLSLVSDGLRQGFGGYYLDDYDAVGNKRIASFQCGFFIQRILETVGVEKWEDLVDKFVRVDGEKFGDIYGIGHITENKWFYPKKEMTWIHDKETG